MNQTICPILCHSLGSCQPLTAEAQVQSRGGAWRISDGQSNNGTSFPWLCWFFPASYCPISATCSFYHSELVQ